MIETKTETKTRLSRAVQNFRGFMRIDYSGGKRKDSRVVVGINSIAWLISNFKIGHEEIICISLELEPTKMNVTLPTEPTIKGQIKVQSCRNGNLRIAPKADLSIIPSLIDPFVDFVYIAVAWADPSYIQLVESN